MDLTLLDTGVATDEWWNWTLLHGDGIIKSKDIFICFCEMGRFGEGSAKIYSSNNGINNLIPKEEGMGFGEQTANETGRPN